MKSYTKTPNRGLKLIKRALLPSLTFFSLQALSNERPNQYIAISFDGSYTSAMWQATREAAQSYGAKVTHFVSGVDFLIGSSSKKIPQSTDHIYIPPGYSGKGRRSDIGFGGTKSMLEERLAQIDKSIQAGMEIGSHANAHFDGTNWSESEWTYEFNWFHKLLLEVFEINPISSAEVGFDANHWKNTLRYQMKSIRSPYLGRGKGLWQTLAKDKWEILGQSVDHKYLYDASDVAVSPSAWPGQSATGGYWYLRMPVIPVPGRTKGVLAMDYNFYVMHSDNPNSPKDKPEQAAEFEEQMYQAYINWFSRNYKGNRAPINIGHHFSTWNKGAYWRALQRFMKDVCQLPEVKCTTGRELVEFLNSVGPNKVSQYQKGDFDRSGLPVINLALAENNFLAANQSKQSLYAFQDNGFVSLPHQTEMVAGNIKNRESIAANVGGLDRGVEGEESYYWVDEYGQIYSEKQLDLHELSSRGVSQLTLKTKKAKVINNNPRNKSVIQGLNSLASTSEVVSHWIIDQSFDQSNQAQLSENNQLVLKSWEPSVTLPVDSELAHLEQVEEKYLKPLNW